MLGKHCVADLELASITVPTLLPWGTTQFQTTLQSPTSDLALLKRKQLALFALRHKDAAATCETVRKHLDSLQSAVPLVDELEAPVDPRIKESIEQIYWSPTSFGAKLNDVRAVISVLVFWKTLVLPALAVLVPLFAIIVPFFLLRYLHGMDISAASYMTHLKRVVLSQVTIPTILRAKHDGDFVGHMLETGFLALTAVTYISGIWSQVTAAQHLRTIAVGLREKGETIGQFVGSFGAILDSLHALPARLVVALRPFLLRGEAIRVDLSEIPVGDGYRLYGHIWNGGEGRQALIAAKAWIGDLDAMLGIVGLREICFPRYCANGTDGADALVLEDVYHPTLSSGISNTVAWRGACASASTGRTIGHAILTGPNRGGKSTLCRAIGISVMCAQSWGFAFAKRMSFSPFEAIETALHPADTLGELSLFEAEIEFAKEVLTKVRKGSRVFVMMDEIFHSTNARDGLAASRVFLEQLFACDKVTSLISTHYKELPAEFDGKALAWAMDAREREDGMLEYTYKKVDGISDKSSVMEILRERGLLTS